MTKEEYSSFVDMQAPLLIEINGEELIMVSPAYKFTQYGDRTITELDKNEVEEIKRKCKNDIISEV